MKALIVFDTKHGATAEVAGRIAQAIRGRGNEVELLDLRQRKTAASLAGYDAIVLGAPFYMGRWSGRAIAFARSREAELLGRTLGIFAVGANAELGDRAARAALPASLGPRVAASAYIGGRYDFAGLGVFERFIVAKVTGKAESSSTLDLEAAEAFGARLADKAKAAAK